MARKTGGRGGGGSKESGAQPDWEAALAPGAVERLLALLPAYLAGRRWFGGKARRIRRAELVDAIPVPPAPGAPLDARLLLVRVGYEAGDPELYVLPAALAPAGGEEALRARLPGAAVGTFALGGRPRLLHAVDLDPAFGRALLAAMAGGLRAAGRAGELVASRTEALAPLLPAAQAATPKPLGAEQSNTSVRFGDAAVVKVLRKVVAGPHPELEVGTFLTTVARYPHTPALLGEISYHPHQGEPIAVAVLQAFVANEGDAWSFSLRRLAAYFDRVGAAGPAPAFPTAPLELAALAPPLEVRALVGSYVEEAALLGRRTAELHLALARGTDDAFAPEPLTTADLGALQDGLRSLVSDTFALLGRRAPELPAAIRPRAEWLLAAEPRLLARLARAPELTPTALRTRTHGDYHLGQVLWTGADFVLIDFEGEPARSLAERRAKRSPLRDVAGMLRSFSYAAFQGLADARARGAGGPGAEGWARAWLALASGSFLRAWLQVTAGASFLPHDPGELRTLLELFLLEKAVYELAYELNNRPDWAFLPLQGIEDLLAEPEAGPPGTGGAPGPAHAAGAAHGEAELSVEALRDWSDGTERRAQRLLGAHAAREGGVAGTSFAVWAPRAARVSVVGDFNAWDGERHPLRPLGPSGVWHGFIAGVGRGARYKYRVQPRQGPAVDKADPFALRHEPTPGNASLVWDLDARWNDAGWIAQRRERNGLAGPISIYEVHLGSWRRVPEEGDRLLTYRELGPLLAEHAEELGFTHVELLPVMEHPFYGSWGYQSTGYFAPTGRHGTPEDLVALVDALHARGIGVLLDWVPAHFPDDPHGLARFDGSPLFEPADPREARHRGWDSLAFDLARPEVRSFLLSSALFWLDAYHADGLRVDAVSSMVLRDHARGPGEWTPNVHGGRERLEGIAFLRELNEAVHEEHPDVLTIAEESDAFPMVTRPVHLGGLGFDLKWDMGWAHDALAYVKQDPVHRKYNHHALTFRAMYAGSERFVLPLSHDDVAPGKSSLLDRSWGHDREKFAGLRLLLADAWAQPGKKLLFMGGEFAQGQAWNPERSLDWHLLGIEPHDGVRRFVGDLNRLLREPALHARDFEPGGFEWIDADDAEGGVLSFLRHGRPGDPDLLVLLHFTAVPRLNYRVGVPRGGVWREVLNSDARLYGGQGWGNLGGAEAAPVGAHGRPFSLVLTVPPLAALFFQAGPA